MRFEILVRWDDDFQRRGGGAVDFRGDAAGDVVAVGVAADSDALILGVALSFIIVLIPGWLCCGDLGGRACCLVFGEGGGCGVGLLFEGDGVRSGEAG